MNLKHKKVLLTGACGGFGSEIARQLHLAGANLVLFGRDDQCLERLAIELNQVENATVDSFVADISNNQGRLKLINYCMEHHRDIDVLINNAGINEFALLSESDGERHEELLEINLSAPIHLVHQLLPLLKSRKEAAIVNIGSTLGSIGFPGYSVYCASKFGLRGFTETLRRELFGSNLQVLYFAPRAINTSMNSNNVNQMNIELGAKCDEPSVVARQLIESLQNGNSRQSFVGWPEKFFTRLNGLLPGLVDAALRKQLAIVKKYSIQ